MRWLLDEDFDRLIEKAKLEERIRCIEIVRRNKEFCADHECRDAFTTVLEEIDAKSQNPLPSSGS